MSAKTFKYVTSCVLVYYSPQRNFSCCQLTVTSTRWIYSCWDNLTICVIFVSPVTQVCIFRNGKPSRKHIFAACTISVVRRKERLCSVSLPQGLELKTLKPEGEMSLRCFDVKWAIWLFPHTFPKDREHEWKFKTLRTLQSVSAVLTVLKYDLKSNHCWWLWKWLQINTDFREIMLASCL